MSKLKCPDCQERTCRFDVTDAECHQCGAYFPSELIEEHAMDASDEGVPMECPYCGRPTIDLIVTGESCSECSYYHPLPGKYLSNLHNDKYDDPGDEQIDDETKNHPEVTIGDNICVVYNEDPRRGVFQKVDYWGSRRNKK